MAKMRKCAESGITSTNYDILRELLKYDIL